MKRLCVYLTYDKQKIIDRYIGFMLKELKTCVDDLAVVCNETEVVSGKEILEKYADDVFYRENIGFDAGGFKDALCSFIGWNRVWQYDELILANDSMFGPFEPMKNIFSEMERRDLDFWGLSRHGEAVTDNLGYIPEHIQSFFLVIRSEMLYSREFREYWENMPYYSTLVETVKQHELKFTDYFSNLGYTYDSLADTTANDSVNIKNNYSQYCFASFEMIRKRGFPFFKKQHISLNTLYWQTQENLRQSLEYIDKETDYDVDLIWENIVRTLDMSDLQRSLHLQYIISSRQMTPVPESVWIAVFVSYKESAEYVLEYIQELKGDYEVCFYSEKEEYLEEYRKCGFLCRKIKSNEIIKIIAEFCDYDFVCVLQDADMTSDRKPSCVGKSYFYNIWENLIKSDTHISGILNRFRKEPRLGFITPPEPNFEDYFGLYKKGWDGKFEPVKNITDKINLNCQICREKLPFCVTDHFWIRGCILKRLNDLGNENVSYLPYLWTYLAQDAGYYSGIVESTEYASMNEVNMKFYLRQIAEQVRKQCGNFDTFSEMKEKMRVCALQGFCSKYSRILVYGAGEVAEKYSDFIPDIEAYIVSDGQQKPDHLRGIPVKYLSDVINIGECGIVLCLNEENQRQVIPLLETHRVEHYFCI